MKPISVALMSLATVLLVSVHGCGGGGETASTDGKGSKKGGRASSSEGSETAGRKKFQPVQLTGAGSEADASKSAKAAIPDEKRVAMVVAALQPFQVMLGEWRWTTNKRFGGVPKTGDDLKWVWD